MNELYKYEEDLWISRISDTAWLILHGPGLNIDTSGKYRLVFTSYDVLVLFTKVDEKSIVSNRSIAQFSYWIYVYGSEQKWV